MIMRCDFARRTGEDRTCAPAARIQPTHLKTAPARRLLCPECHGVKYVFDTPSVVTVANKNFAGGALKYTGPKQETESDDDTSATISPISGDAPAFRTRRAQAGPSVRIVQSAARAMPAVSSSPPAEQRPTGKRSRGRPRKNPLGQENKGGAAAGPSSLREPSAFRLPTEELFAADEARESSPSSRAADQPADRPPVTSAMTRAESSSRIRERSRSRDSPNTSLGRWRETHQRQDPPAVPAGSSIPRIVPTRKVPVPRKGQFRWQLPNPLPPHLREPADKRAAD